MAYSIELRETILEAIENLMGIAVLKPINWDQLVTQNAKNLRVAFEKLIERTP